MLLGILEERLSMEKNHKGKIYDEIILYNEKIIFA